MILKTCPNCAVTFFTNRPRTKFCSISCGVIVKKGVNRTRFCECCNTIFERQHTDQKYCSRSCSATSNNTGQVKSNEVRKKIKQTLADGGYLLEKGSSRTRVMQELARKTRLQNTPRYHCTCSVCNANYEVPFSRRDSKYCSRKCYLTTSGGVKPGSGRSKSGWYSGIWCDSTWELAYVIYCLDHNIPIYRNKQSWDYIKPDGSVRKYFPDFVVDGHRIVEIKNFMSEEVAAKLRAVNVELILGKTQMKPFIDHVCMTYRVTKTGMASLYQSGPA